MIQSLERGIAIMKYLAYRKSASVTEIAMAFDIDKSSASRILMTLANQDIVYKNKSNQKYSLSVGALIFSYQLMSTHAIMEVCHSILQDLMVSTQEMVHLCTLQNDHIYVLDQVKSPAYRYYSESSMPGMTEPYHCSAVGKVILANMPANETRLLLKREQMFSYTENTIINMDDLFEQLVEVKQQGYAMDMEEYTENICCLAVPVYDTYGYATFSLGISGFSKNFASTERLNMYLAMLRKAAQNLSTEYNAYVQKHPI